MKKIYLLLSSSILALNIQAQYTVTSAANNPTLGESQTTYNADTTGVVIGTSGANQIWNYTSIVVQPTTAVTSTYVATNSAPNFTAFPGATISQTSGNGDYTLWGYTPTQAVLYGFSNSTLTAVYSNPEILYSMPFTFGSLNSDTYGGTFTIGVNSIVRTGNVTTTGEGYGTLNLPNGKTYTNVLKIKLTQTVTDIVAALSYTNTNVTNSYIYINASSKNSILTVENTTSTTTFTSITTTKTKSVKVDQSTIVGLKENKREANFSLYPNPTNTNEISLFYVIGNEDKYELTIINTVGQIVKTKSLNNQTTGMYSEIIDLNGLDKGLYFIKLKGNHNEGIQKIIIQ